LFPEAWPAFHVSWEWLYFDGGLLHRVNRRRSKTAAEDVSLNVKSAFAAGSLSSIPHVGFWIARLAVSM
jgi:hypothetical protein